MVNRCHYCGSVSWYLPLVIGLCLSCREELFSHRRYGSGRIEGFEIFTAFSYQGLVRELILAVKIKGFHQCLQTWQDLLLRLPEVKDLLPTVESITACPSSRWSRSRGKIDLAWMVAHNLAKQSGASFIKPPARFRTSKQSFEKRRYKVFGRIMSPTIKSESDKGLLLVVDDVVTTGTTLLQVALALKWAGPVGFFTLADARPSALARDR